jgi:hypothetical protein
VLKPQEQIFNFFACVREKSVAKTVENDSLVRDLFEEQPGADLRLLPPLSFSRERYPVKLHIGMFFHQAENRSTASDLDIIGMCAEA